MAIRRKRNHTLRFKQDLWGQWELPNVESEAGTTDMWGTLVSEMQSDVEVNGCYITGELNYLTTGQLVTDWGEGYFIALKLTDIGDNLTDVKVGLTPSAGSGLVSIDSDANVVCHITDKNTQKFTVWATDGVTSRTNYYDLSGLTLNEEPPTPKGEVLFDGTVTLDENGEGTLTLGAQMEAWKLITASYDGHDASGISSVYNGSIGVNLQDEQEYFHASLAEDGYILLSDENGDPVTGEVTIKVTQEEPTLMSIFDGSVSLTSTGQGVFGTFEVSQSVDFGIALFIYVDGSIKAHGFVDSQQIEWEDGGYGFAVVADSQATTWQFGTNDTSLNSVNLKIAISAT